MKALETPEDIHWAHETLDLLTYNSSRISLEQIEARGWTVVLSSGSLWADDNTPKALKNALIEAGLDQVWAINTFQLIDEDGRPDYSDFVYVLSVDQIPEFIHEKTVYNYLLTTDAFDFAVLLTYEDYAIFAGPDEFIERVFSRDAAFVQKEFNDYALERLNMTPSLPDHVELKDYYRK